MAHYNVELQAQPARRDMGRVWNTAQLAPQSGPHRKAPERKEEVPIVATFVKPEPRHAHFSKPPRAAPSLPKPPARPRTAPAKSTKPKEGIFDAYVPIKGDPVADLHKRLERLNQLWEVQRGRDRDPHAGMMHADLKGAPRLVDGWSSKLARDCCMKQLEAEAVRRSPPPSPRKMQKAQNAAADKAQAAAEKAQAAAVHRGGSLRGFAAPSAAPAAAAPPPPPPPPVLKPSRSAVAAPTILEKARWARCEEQLNEYLQARGRPPRRGPANDRDPRGHSVRTWELARALNALPSDAMRHEDFGHTIMQSGYLDAKLAVAAADVSLVKPVKRGAWD